MSSESRALQAMVFIRLLSSLTEFVAALLMLKFGNLRSALKINAMLGLVGPTILLSATLVGIAGLAGRVPVYKLALIVLGVGLVLLGTR